MKQLRRPVFKDSLFQESFDQNGFVLIDLFSEKEFSGLVDVVTKLNNNKGSQKFNVETNYKLSFFGTESGFKKQVLDLIGN
jgi:hypothetical protein